MVEVTEVDERAASTIRRGVGGKYDREHQRNVQAFAAHRTAATAAKDARIVELEVTAAALWALLDDIDTLDDAAKGDDAAFRENARDIQRRRFAVMSGELFDQHHNAARKALGEG